MWNNENIWNLKGFHAITKKMQISGDIRLLHLIEKRGPRNGAEILEELQTISDSRIQYMNHMHPKRFGYSKPSPSYVYPALKKVECEGLISKNKEDKYELTKKGKISLNELHEVFKTDKRGKDDAFNIENAFTELDSNIDYLEDTGKEKLKDHLESIENLIIRLKNIKELLEQ
jgi:DNA-binding PadR family transcriptional regulator